MAVRASGGERRRRPAVVAAEGHAGLVEDQWPGAFAAGLGGAAVATDDGRCRPAAVDDQDRPFTALDVEAVNRAGEPGRDQAPVAAGQLGPQVDDLDTRRRARGSGRKLDSPI